MKMQNNPAGEHITVGTIHTILTHDIAIDVVCCTLCPTILRCPLQIEPDGTHVQINPNGNKVVKHVDGTVITHLATGEKIIQYPDGRRKQTGVDGSGIIFDENGNKTRFVQREDIVLERSIAASLEARARNKQALRVEDETIEQSPSDYPEPTDGCESEDDERCRLCADMQNNKCIIL